MLCSWSVVGAIARHSRTFNSLPVFKCAKAIQVMFDVWYTW